MSRGLWGLLWILTQGLITESCTHAGIHRSEQCEGLPTESWCPPLAGTGCGLALICHMMPSRQVRELWITFKKNHSSLFVNISLKEILSGVCVCVCVCVVSQPSHHQGHPILVPAVHRAICLHGFICNLLAPSLWPNTSTALWTHSCGFMLSLPLKIREGSLSPVWGPSAGLACFQACFLPGEGVYLTGAGLEFKHVVCPLSLYCLN